MPIPAATSATEQSDGSLRVVYSDGSVRFVPGGTEGNREFEALHLQVLSGFRVQNATAKGGLRPADCTARETRRGR